MDHLVFDKDTRTTLAFVKTLPDGERDFPSTVAPAQIMMLREDKLPLWNSLDEAKRQMEYSLDKCNVLKITDNELKSITGKTDLGKDADILRDQYPNTKRNK